MIKINNLQKYYSKGKSNEIHVINNTSIEIPSKGLITFLGASGSGKTTLLNVIGGLDSAKGDITYDNIDFNNYHMGKIDKYRMKNIGYVFQNYNLLPNLSVQDNLAISLNLLGINDEQEVLKRIDYCLAAVKMGKYKKRLASALSGGQQQRISIARALVKNSKIIIADEPTGNLDSVNTVEVMNILKKISETKLVLLVTHDRKIAQFYSDRIIEIKDGSIISDDENHMGTGTLDTRSSRVIYLQDLKKTEAGFENIKMSIYSDDRDLQDISLNVIFKDGSIYIAADNKNVKLIGGNTEVSLLDEHYEELSKADVNKYEFNLSGFNDTPSKHKFSFPVLGRKIKTALSNFFNVRGRTKFLYFGFVVIGGILASCAISLGMYNHVDEDSLMYEKNTLSINSNEAFNYGNDSSIFVTKLKKLVTSQHLDDIYLRFDKEYYFTFDFKINGSYQTFNGQNSTRAFCLPAKNLTPEVIYKEYGSLPQNKSEIAIDKTVCDRIIKSTSALRKIDYNHFIGLSVRCDSVDLIVSGIVDNDSVAAYYFGDYFYNETGMNLESNNEFIDYKVVEGTDIDDTTVDQVLININKAGSLYEKIGEKIIVNNPSKESKAFMIKGYFSSNTVDSAFIVNDEEYVKYDSISSMKQKPYFDLSKYAPVITEGRMPEKPNEILVNYYTDTKVGSSISIRENDGTTNNVVVVGKYYAADKLRGYYGTTHEFFLLNQIIDYAMPSQYYFYSSNPEKLIQEFAYYGLELDYSKEVFYNYQLKDNRLYYTFLYIVVAVLFVMVIVYIYLMMRAKMINRIYDIGVYRALGASRRKIYSLFFVELLVLTTFTTLIGYIFVCLMFGGIAKMLKDVGDIFHFNPLYLISGVGLLYLFNIVFGLLPVTLLLRKTPSEIISKYDI